MSDGTDADRIEQLEAKLAKAVDALDEAVYLLRPDEKDMMRQAGVYRIVTTLAELKEPSVKQSLTVQPTHQERTTNE